MYDNVIVKERKVFEEDNHLYLKLVYEYRDERGIHELIIPKIDLEIRTDQLPTITDKHDFTLYCSIMNHEIQRYSDVFRLLRDNAIIRKNGEELVCPNASYIINTIKENPHEMTLSEIEKKLGYKVKLVSEKEENADEQRD